MQDNLTNWAGNYEYRAARIHNPNTVEQIQELVVGGTKLRALGTRHSFNSIADSAGDLISTNRLDRIVSLDRANHTVTVEAGIRYGTLAGYLSTEGFALHNLASLPHISVAGACATATHGSGDNNGNLATAVAALEFVAADGSLQTLSRGQDGEQFNGAVVALGGLGIVTKVTLDILPTFDVSQTVYENLPWTRLLDSFDAITSSAYSVSLFTDWRSGAVNEVWLKARDGERATSEFFGATAATRNMHPIATRSAENCTEQMGIAGPWQDRLPHFRMGFIPSSGEELQTEYLAPRQHAVAALIAVSDLREQIAPVLQISEIRTVAADNLWMSPCYRQACVGIHFTWKKDWPAVRELLPVIEERLAPFDARPHWGKLFTMPPTRVQALYERLPEFRTLLLFYDPGGKFRNAFLDRFIFG